MFTFGAKKYLPLLCLLLCALCGFFTDAVAKPTIAFNLPQSFQGFPSFASFTQQYFESRNLRQMKTYSGKRLTNESLIMIYYHDSTIAVTELGPEKLLLGCELIEIYNEKDGKALLEGLSKYNRPLRITFDEMLKLMNQCERVDKLTYASRNRAKAIDVNTNNDSSANNNNNGVTNLAANIFPKSPFSLLSGIIPGTKWCGTGDIAETYSDLGTDMDMDRCCRLHDLCPVKIRAYQNKYELMNDSLYTKSHCICDDMLYSCLKKANTPASQLMGSIYFNLVRVPCLAGSNDKYRFREAKEGF
ncbi:phospholipase A2 hemilipin-like [Rhagoletis pomonella]|uniref:phospholipase A2 hemilipin-like n=1 Tax=Rhagoletis pomonella TaxID=28610 RepID=UPI001784A772|nr:phospholipase A2 hemilipin-like [Rhagoletis pomonella]XP_036341650.1 phospholipase A2 hemilipin-like [Rhagoletis pomonella]XP_036341707.1 phospholipase A2 hemilipin-like [Rhagoletis pomonella]XP_036341718.1 phospholipase A2 hemilipin-like [Rhagoletis pomonella]